MLGWIGKDHVYYSEEFDLYPVSSGMIKFPYQ